MFQISELRDIKKKRINAQSTYASRNTRKCKRVNYHNLHIRDDQEGLFKLVTLDRILNRITGVTFGCWWLVVVNAILVSKMDYSLEFELLGK
jgi:hypothetical protein